MIDHSSDEQYISSLDTDSNVVDELDNVPEKGQHTLEITGDKTTKGLTEVNRSGGLVGVVVGLCETEERGLV